MKIIEYQCNICSDRYNHQQAVVEKKVLACYFTGYKDFELRTLPQETDRHICIGCIESLRTSHNKKMVANPPYEIVTHSPT